MQPRSKIWTIAIASITVIAAMVLVLGLEIRNQSAVARSDSSAKRQDAPAVQQMKIIPADASAPLGADWHPLVGDHSN